MSTLNFHQSLTWRVTHILPNMIAPIAIKLCFSPKMSKVQMGMVGSFLELHPSNLIRNNILHSFKAVTILLLKSQCEVFCPLFRMSLDYLNKLKRVTTVNGLRIFLNEWIIEYLDFAVCKCCKDILRGTLLIVSSQSALPRLYVNWPFHFANALRYQVSEMWAL